MCSVVLKKTTEQKETNSPKQKRDSIIRQIKTDVPRMETTTTNIPPSHPQKNQPLPP